MRPDSFFRFSSAGSHAAAVPLAALVYFSAAFQVEIVGREGTSLC